MCTYGCFAGRFALSVPASVGGAFAVLWGHVSFVKEYGDGRGGLVLSACCFMNFSLAPDPPGVLVGIFVIYVEVLNCGGICGWEGVGDFGDWRVLVEGVVGVR